MKKLRDIMRPGFMTTVKRDATVAEAVAAMTSNNTGLVVVVEDGRLVGVFSERDVVRRVVNRGLDPATTRVNDVLTTDLVVGDADSDYQEAMRIMDQANIRHLPVVDKDRLVGMVSIGDVVKAQRDHYQGEVDTLQTQLLAGEQGLTH